MKQLLFNCGMTACMLALLCSVAQANDGQMSVRVDGTNTLLQVRGDKDDEWRFQTSTDLITWSNAHPLGTVFAGKTGAAWTSAGVPDSSQRFFRAVQTTGLYDPMVLRTLCLTFTQSNWQSLLTKGRTTGSNTLCTLATDGVLINDGAGARYRGNTSFSGMGGDGTPTKKSINIKLDYINAASDLMGYDTLNLNNAYGDKTLMREMVYFNVMQAYTICPRCSLAKLYINNEFWGVYSFAQQEDGSLIKEWCPSNNGDRWRAPNMPGMGTGPGGWPGGGGPGGSSSVSALSYLGTNLATYRANYQLKTTNSTNAWERLRHATDVLNNTPTNQLRDKVEDVLAVDRWLWFLAIENIFADDDSYFNKGADYGFYYEPESGRIHPVEHDGNESFVPADVQLSPVQGSTGTSRPLLGRLLAIPELRQRYLAHMRVVLHEFFNPPTMTYLINEYSALSLDAIAADTKKRFTMAVYSNNLTSLKTFVANRHKFLTNHAELRPVPPVITAVYIPAVAPLPSESACVTAHVQPSGNEGVDSVWLYHRGKSYGRFTTVQMFDDGAHSDGLAGDGLYGAAVNPYPAATKVRFYVEARSANNAKAASFAPARAEEDTYIYRVGLSASTSAPVVINEFMADNLHCLADPQGEFDDWIELRNLTGQDVDLAGHYLTDDPAQPRKWVFPDGTLVSAGGFLLVWADEDGAASPGLHANFKLAASGEQILLIDTDANLNAVLDSISFDAQDADRSYGRLPSNPDDWAALNPTPGQPNQ